MSTPTEVLVLDDEPLVCERLKDHLERKKYRVEVFTGGWKVGGLRAGFQPWILSNPVELQVPDPDRVAGGL